MLEDVLLITDKHRKAATVIVEEILKRRTDKYDNRSQRIYKG